MKKIGIILFALLISCNTKTEEEKLEEVIFLYAGDSAKIAEVETGIQDDEFIQIVTGLNTDDEVVSGPYSALSKVLEDGTELRKKEDEKKDKE